MTAPIEIFRKLFAEGELEELLEKAFETLRKYTEMIENPEKDSFNQAYRMAVFYSLDIAHIYDLLGDREKAEKHYRATIEYLDCADFQPLWIRIECLDVLGKHKEALEAALDDSHYTKLGLAKLYEKAGKHDVAREIYTELAMEQSKKAIKSKFLPLLFLQHASDLWARAQRTEEARKYNERAVKAWERMKDRIERSLHTIEEAWLFEEVGYIYEQAGKIEIAINYYKKAKAEYELAYTEDFTATGAHQVDGDWDYYARCFYFQLPEILKIELSLEYSMMFDFRRIKYRMLNLEEKMRG